MTSSQSSIELDHSCPPSHKSARALLHPCSDLNALCNAQRFFSAIVQPLQNSHRPSVVRFQSVTFYPHIGNYELEVVIQVLCFCSGNISTKEEETLFDSNNQQSNWLWLKADSRRHAVTCRRRQWSYLMDNHFQSRHKSCRVGGFCSSLHSLFFQSRY